MEEVEVGLVRAGQSEREKVRSPVADALSRYASRDARQTRAATSAVADGLA